MADTIPAPEKPMTRFEAQRKLGLFATNDYVMLGLVALSLLLTANYAIFGSRNGVILILGVLTAIFFMLLWLVVLAYRVLVFILDLHSDIALMPEAAARIAAGYFEGRVPRK